MRYLVVTTERAAKDIEESAAWWAENRSVEQAQHWYDGIRAAIAELGENPLRWAVAYEQEKFSYELRELHFGLGSQQTHRVLYTIVKESVVVLTVRHSAQRPLSPSDLGQ